MAIEKQTNTKGRYLHYNGGFCTSIYGYSMNEVAEVKRLLGKKYPDYPKWKNSFKEISPSNTERVDRIESLWCVDWEKKIRWEQLMYVNPLPNITYKISPYEADIIQKLWQQPEKVGSLYVYRNFNSPWGIETTLAVPKNVAESMARFDWKETLSEAVTRREEIEQFRKSYEKIADTVIPGCAYPSMSL